MKACKFPEASELKDRIRAAVFSAYCYELPILKNPEKLLILRENLCVPESETVYLAFDGSLSLSAKFGTALTERGIYLKPPHAAPMCTPWEDIPAGIVYNDNTPGSVYLMEPDSMSRMLLALTGRADSAVLDFFRRLLAAIREIFPGEQQLPFICRKAPDCSGLDYEALIGSFFRSFRPDVLNDLSAGGDFFRLRLNLLVPPDEKLYFCHDDSILRNGIHGSIMTGRGIYSDCLGEGPAFVSWKDFAENPIYALKGNIYLDSGFKDPYIGFFSSSSEKALILYCSIQKALRLSALGMDAGAAESLTPAEEFSLHYDFSSVERLFKTENLPVMRAVCEAKAGRVSHCYMASRFSLLGSKTVWIGLGEKGISFTGNNFISWESFLSGTLSLRNGTDLSPDPDSILDSDYNQGFGLYINNIQLPCADYCHCLQFYIFFQELQRFMKEPKSYRRNILPWNDSREQLLLMYQYYNKPQGLFKKPDKEKSQLIHSSLQLPYGKDILYYISDKGLTGPEKFRLIIDRSGIFWDLESSLEYLHCSFEDFISYPLYAVSFKDYGIYLSGSRLIARLYCSREMQHKSFEFLSALRREIMQDRDLSFH